MYQLVTVYLCTEWVSHITCSCRKMYVNEKIDVEQLKQKRKNCNKIWCHSCIHMCPLLKIWQSWTYYSASTNLTSRSNRMQIYVLPGSMGPRTLAISTSCVGVRDAGRHGHGPATCSTTLSGLVTPDPWLCGGDGMERFWIVSKMWLRGMTEREKR